MAAFVASAVTWNTSAGNKSVAITPAVGELLVAIVGNTSITTDPVVSDNQGGTYTRVTTRVLAGSAHELHVYVRDQLVTSAVSHTVTETAAGSTGGGLEVQRWSGITRVGAAAVRQATTGQDNQAAGTTPTHTFPAACLTGNPTIFTTMGSNTVNTMPAGWTTRQNVSYATPSARLITGTRDSGFTGSSQAWSGTLDGQYASIGVELDTSVPSRRAQVSFAELEVPNAPRRGQVSFAELEVPTAPRRGLVSFAELEVPTAPRRARVSFAELEVGDAPRRALVSFAELEVPDAATTDRRARMSFAELEVPDAPRRAQISFAELEVGEPPRRALLSFAELEVPDDPNARRALISFAEFQVPTHHSEFVVHSLGEVFPHMGRNRRKLPYLPRHARRR